MSNLTVVLIYWCWLYYPLQILHLLVPEVTAAAPACIDMVNLWLSISQCDNSDIVQHWAISLLLVYYIILYISFFLVIAACLAFYVLFPSHFSFLFLHCLPLLYFTLSSSSSASIFSIHLTPYLMYFIVEVVSELLWLMWWIHIPAKYGMSVNYFGYFVW